MSGIMVGIGFSSAAQASDIAWLVARCLDGRTAAALAVPAARADRPEAAEAARALGLPVVVVATAAIAAVQARCLTPPGRARMSVAEGAALAAAGEDARLLGPRVCAARVTCALAAA